MNEHIKQAATECGLWAILEEWSCEFGNCDAEFDCQVLKTFAESIIAECIAQVRKDENGPAYEAVGRIAEHFGVEDE